MPGSYRADGNAPQLAVKGFTRGALGSKETGCVIFVKFQAGWRLQLFGAPGVAIFEAIHTLIFALQTP
jgi:hypothetical protein